MATLEKIRSKAGLLVIVVGLALFAFIIGDFLNSGSTYFKQHQETVADVNGKTVNIQDFQKRIEEMTEVYKMQTGSANLPEEYMVQIRQSVFDNLVQEIVLTGEMEQLGMTVTPEELFDMVQGENISPLLLQNQMFHNPETGVFDKTFFLNFLKQIDPENIASAPAEYRAQLLQYSNLWLFWEKNIKTQRMEQKYTTLLGKAIVANSLDAKEAFKAAGESADIVYAMQSYATIPDSTISVGKSEIEKLYNQRKELFKQAEAKVIKYIAVDIVPSQEDFDKVSANMEQLKDELATTEDVRGLVNDNSEVSYMDAFFSENALDAEMKQFVTTAAINDIYGPVFENSSNKYRMFKLVDKTSAPDSVKVSHIMLLNANGAETALADSLMDVLKKGGNFAELASAHSIDNSSAANGGEIGWLTEVAALNALNEEFKTIIFSTPLNEVVLFKSTQATHLIKVTERTSNVTKYKVADIDITVTPSSKTYSNLYNALNQYISNNQNMDKMDATAQEAGYNLLTNVSVTATDQVIGSIPQSRSVIRWAFEHSKGDISEIFDCDNKYFVVAALQGTVREGYRSLASVESSLKSELIAQKKGEKIAAELKAKNLTSLDAYAQAMNASVDSVKFISFNTSRISGIGMEPKLNAMISLTEVNRLSDPVIGNNGVYVFQVVNKEQNNREYNEAEEIRTLEATFAYRYGYQAMRSLIGRAEIVDNRIRFY
ncbi:MAG: SurA N-terminal domain-containing protein [Tannerellaceae bacterium]|jgi:peptidyl-prolyl cis-trans isomerase D|nr:SurA N-terminal domain-containing protein [Tannerellaceae bacterium]